MIRDLGFALADQDFYAPLSQASPGREYHPTAVPAGWTRTDADVWSMWSPPHPAPDQAVDGSGGLPEQGWKVHVSAPVALADQVLDVVAAACGDLGVAFKHLRGTAFFVLTHAKHAHRGQSGKFCALYPRDPEQAGRLLERLDRDLAGVEGPYVLTDRRFGDSRCVHYRYGAFSARYELRADGTRTPVVLAADGTQVPDERAPQFRLPVGVVDPWAPPVPVTGDGTDDDGDVSFHGYTFEKVLQHSNAGGAYRARDGRGDAVFVKEARAHNGYTSPEDDADRRLRREHLVLTALHRLAPGLAPRPVELFRHWEHTYLVTELVPGRGLHEWVVANTPYIRVDPDPADVGRYLTRVRHVLDQVRTAVTRLHDLGYLFGDLSVRNVLVDDDDTARLIDFECAQPLSQPLVPMGTPGFMPPELLDDGARAAMDPRDVDRYALGALARAALVPQLDLGGRNPAALPHAEARLRRYGPLPGDLWDLAAADARARGAQGPGWFPTPEQVRDDVPGELRRLRDRTADALEALVRPDDPTSVWPTCPDGLSTNTRCLAYGTAGVVHALDVAGRAADPRVVDRLRDDSLRHHADTPPGFLLGTAGVAWLLARRGDVDAARDLLDEAARHPLTATAASWGGGAAGVAAADLALHRLTGDDAHLHRAQRLLLALPTGDALTPLLGAHDPSGLVHGRTGVALALGLLADATGDPEPLRRGLRLLGDELRHALDVPTGAVGFRVSTKDRRNMPYLGTGSAGYALVGARYLTRAHRADLDVPPEVTAAVEGALRATSLRLTVSSGLLEGQAGLGLVAGDLARVLGRPDLREAQLDSATALFQHAVPHESGTRWLGGVAGRLSCELWSGAAGVLLALSHAVDPFDDPLFTSTAVPAPALVAGDRAVDDHNLVTA
ncbi:class III lanthionine synthetase LanKC [Thalassiella azotivora]